MSMASVLCENLLKNPVILGNFTLKELLESYGLRLILQKCRRVVLVFL